MRMRWTTLTGTSTTKTGAVMQRSLLYPWAKSGRLVSGTFANHRLCDKCHSSCHQSGKTLCRTCKAKKKARKKCKVCESTSKKWTTLQPKHGSVIVLPHDYNLTYEHAVLGKQDAGGDKGPKGLRISINTKNIREQDALYVD
jgi:hypothetical protein